MLYPTIDSSDAEVLSFHSSARTMCAEAADAIAMGFDHLRRFGEATLAIDKAEHLAAAYFHFDSASTKAKKMNAELASVAASLGTQTYVRHDSSHAKLIRSIDMDWRHRYAESRSKAHQLEIATLARADFERLADYHRHLRDKAEAAYSKGLSLWDDRLMALKLG